MLLFLRNGTCFAGMQIKIKKRGDAIISATHGMSPIDFLQSSMVRQGTKAAEKLGIYFIKKSKHRKHMVGN